MFDEERDLGPHDENTPEPEANPTSDVAASSGAPASAGVLPWTATQEKRGNGLDRYRDSLCTAAVYTVLDDRFEVLDLAREIKKLCRTEECWISLRATGPRSGDWYAWNGRVHELLSFDLVDHLLVTEYLDALRKDCLSGAKIFRGDSEPAKRLMRMWANLGSASMIRNLRQLVRDELRVPPETFDHDKRWIAQRNGWVLDSWSLDSPPRAPHPTRFITRHLGVSLDDYHGNFYIDDGDLIEDPEDLTPHRFLQALAEYVPDEEEQRFLQECCGAALLGRGDAKNIPHLVGPKNTGKSTFLRIMVRIFGEGRTGYAKSLAASALVDKANGSNFAQADAQGARFLFVSEPSRKRVDDSFLKNLSGGGEAIRTERKNKDHEEWYAECVLFIAANSPVNFGATDRALGERINIVEFRNVIKDVDSSFVDVLLDAEGGLILRWVIEGAKRYEERRHVLVPQSILRRSQAVALEGSGPLKWLAEAQDENLVRLEPDLPRSNYIHRSEARKLYLEWCAENEEAPYSAQEMTRAIHEFLNAPADANQRSGGYHRLWGVVERGGDSDSGAEVHSDSGGESVNTEQLSGPTLVTGQTDALVHFVETDSISDSTHE